MCDLLSCSCPSSDLPAGSWYTDMVGCSIRRSSIGCVGAGAGPPVKVVAGISTHEPSEAIDSISQSCGPVLDVEPGCGRETTVS